MRRTLLGLFMGGLIVAAGTAPARAEGCFGYHQGCVGMCTPDRIARYYAGSARRCTTSCEPRYSQCIRSGSWADLERLHGGGYREASGL